jgi:hypothetical protein
VAKVYDPLYYNFEEPGHHGMPTDVMWNAARNYSIKTEAYQQLLAYDKSCEATIPRDESKNIHDSYPAFFGFFSITFKLVCMANPTSALCP